MENPLDDPDTTNKETLPCGCRLGQLHDMFLYEPCSLTCEFYQYTLGEAQRVGKPIEERHVQ